MLAKRLESVFSLCHLDFSPVSLLLSSYTFANCCLVPMMMNSVALSFRLSWSFIIQVLIALMHFSIASIALDSENAQSALNVSIAEYHQHMHVPVTDTVL